MALWLCGALVILALAGAAVVLRGPTAAPDGGAQQAGDAAPTEPAGPAGLSARLTFVPAGPGDDHALVVRLYDPRARLRETVRQAADAGRPWNGAIDDAAAAAPAVTAPPMPLEAWQAAISVETITPDGTATLLPANVVTVVRAPEAALDFGAGNSEQVVIALSAGALPAPGTLVRVRFATAPFEAATTPAPVPAPPAAGTAGLTASARAAELLGRPDVVAARADALIAAAADAASGYYYRGVALEAQGDRAGAIAAYEAALARTPEGPEPPIGITARLARLR
ncbi:MAG: hypothetical protein AB7N90_13155 [Vicinamibacterales bacterium]